jgi:cholesterol oxidase
VIVDGDTQLEFLTYGRSADLMTLFFTVLVGDGPHPIRLLKWLARVARHPVPWLKTLWPFGSSRRTMMLLVMQARDNAIAFRAKKRRFGRGYRVSTQAVPDKPAPTYIDVGHRAATWLAERTGGIAQSSIFEAFGNMPMTAHVIGGAVVGADTDSGVLDQQLRVFGYENLIVCDAAALPANPGVNPALTITALAEYGIAHVPTKAA